mmetsp:Transcript_79310/g.184065  ORF Transcript_79310/g.184065 Transcript_79310/m.184065 type:complete len:183 (+) Transcript_79310:97-645(+)
MWSPPLIETSAQAVEADQNVVTRTKLCDWTALTFGAGRLEASVHEPSTGVVAPVRGSSTPTAGTATSTGANAGSCTERRRQTAPDPALVGAPPAPAKHAPRMAASLPTAAGRPRIGWFERLPLSGLSDAEVWLLEGSRERTHAADVTAPAPAQHARASAGVSAWLRAGLSELESGDTPAIVP